MTSQPSSELPLEIDDPGAAPSDRVVPGDQHPWAPSALEIFTPLPICTCPRPVLGNHESICPRVRDRG